MWSWLKPSCARIETFLQHQQALAFSYVEIGASRDGAPEGYDLDHNRIVLGRGEDVFDKGCQALRAWRMFPRPWTEIHPAAPLREGQTVAMLARAFGLWWLNACRIVYTIDENREHAGRHNAAPRRFGFAYGTLPAHVERGEERFLIEQDEQGAVWYDIRAFSTPRYWLVRLGYPLARRLQRRFVRESQQAMRDAVSELGAPA